MADLSGFDAAYPPSHAPADQVVMGYLGGDTPHAWTPGEWGAQPARYRIGVWTRSDPVGAAQGKTEGAVAVAAWRALGAPSGTLIVLDLETAVNAAYVTAFDAQVVADGFRVAIYGSKDTLFRNPKTSGGYFTADLTGSPHLYPGTTITQWRFESLWDDDEISGAVTGWLWDTQAAAAGTTTTTTTAQGAGSLEEDDMRTTSVNGRAGLAWGAGGCHVVEVNYANADQPDLVLDVELKLTSGPVYPGKLTVSHLTGTGTYEIPSSYIAACRGVILTVASGPAGVVYDVCAV